MVLRFYGSLYHGATCMKKNAAKTIWNYSIVLAVKTETPVSKPPSPHAEDGVPLMSPGQSWTDLTFIQGHADPGILTSVGAIQPWQESDQCFFFTFQNWLYLLALLKFPLGNQFFTLPWMM